MTNPAAECQLNFGVDADRNIQPPFRFLSAHRQTPMTCRRRRTLFANAGEGRIEDFDRVALVKTLGGYSSGHLFRLTSGDLVFATGRRYSTTCGFATRIRDRAESPFTSL